MCPPSLASPEPTRAPALPEITRQHLDKVRAFYEGAPAVHRAAARSYRGLLAHYYNLLIPADASVLEIGCGSGELLARIRFYPGRPARASNSRRL